MDAIFNKLRNLDAYPKINEDFYRRTFSGGLITLASSFFMLFLFFSELRMYLHAKTETQLVVDTSRGGKLHINFDLSFPSIPCSILSLDAIDISGEQHLDIRHNIIKKRIDHHGNVIEARPDGIGAPKIEKPLQRHGGRLEHNETYCGSCFGAEASDDHCCNSCEEVREAYRQKGWAITNQDLIDQCQREDFIQKVKDEEGEGCNIEGTLEVNKVAGSFHFVPGKSFHQSSFNFLGLLALQTSDYNVSHRINRLAFGDHYDGLVNPLDGVHWEYNEQNVMHQYFVKVVPTIYKNIRGRTVHSNQYSVTEHFKSVEFGSSQSIPGVFFYYDLSPVKIDKIKMWVEVFEYKVGSFPSSYFGLSLSGKPRAMMKWFSFGQLGGGGTPLESRGLEIDDLRIRHKTLLAKWLNALPLNMILYGLLWDSSHFRESVFDVVRRNKVPKKVKFFVWQVLLGRGNTINRLICGVCLGRTSALALVAKGVFEPRLKSYSSICLLERYLFLFVACGGVHPDLGIREDE
ncbi:endoplasmic reticulum-Golgi intermediate compartment protein 3-like [Cucumis melo var. makuwa]|uniref:Endoplasmic reticulum-Golgi intermediate compartment protein 3-like n=1 Tax=Cucumis melo var. makuwa TaxID=1194695 RepID=A0A5D3CVQ5_CUCMM|nr:endoplasmic reticulum-Golgi intermediate compartment protein 3-like [Cucumis melo var. makuwa]